VYTFGTIYGFQMVWNIIIYKYTYMHNLWTSEYVYILEMKELNCKKKSLDSANFFIEFFIWIADKRNL
jgi:hypothetical protein